jgi:hypothetical protein
VTRTLRERREHGGEHATGEVVVGDDHASGGHARLAGARAWIDLGSRLLEAGDAEGAAACAREGLRELGSDSKDRTAVDDTELKLLAAESQLEAGNVSAAAGGLLRVLEARAALYRDAHADAIVA